jgi:DNA polymerase-3 subunit delta
MVVVQQADDFVSQHRSELEDYCGKPRGSVLVLMVQSWLANTRLYKKIAEMGLTINCNLPRGRFGDIDEDAVLAWLEKRAQRQYQVHLEAGAGEMLLEIVGTQLGRLDQELAKLALLADSAPQFSRDAKRSAGPTTPNDKQRTMDNEQRTISRQLVEQSVGGWRTKTAWVMIEQALEGNAATALVELDRLLLAGEEPIALLAMMSGSLRRMAAAARIAQQALAERGRRIPLQEALREAGVTPKKFVLDKTEKQLKQIGWPRAKQIYHWLLEADLALKGSRSQGRRARLVLEELIVRLSKQLAPYGR